MFQFCMSFFSFGLLTYALCFSCFLSQLHHAIDLFALYATPVVRLAMLMKFIAWISMTILLAVLGLILYPESHPLSIFVIRVAPTQLILIFILPYGVMWVVLLVFHRGCGFSILLLVVTSYFKDFYSYTCYKGFILVPKGFILVTSVFVLVCGSFGCFVGCFIVIRIFSLGAQGIHFSSWESLASTY